MFTDEEIDDITEKLNSQIHRFAKHIFWDFKNRNFEIIIFVQEWVVGGAGVVKQEVLQKERGRKVKIEQLAFRAKFWELSRGGKYLERLLKRAFDTSVYPSVTRAVCFQNKCIFRVYFFHMLFFTFSNLGISVL